MTLKQKAALGLMLVGLSGFGYGVREVYRSLRPEVPQEYTYLRNLETIMSTDYDDLQYNLPLKRAHGRDTIPTLPELNYSVEEELSHLQKLSKEYAARLSDPTTRATLMRYFNAEEQYHSMDDRGEIVAGGGCLVFLFGFANYNFSRTQKQKKREEK